jgi:hypothetical protein
MCPPNPNIQNARRWAKWNDGWDWELGLAGKWLFRSLLKYLNIWLILSVINYFLKVDCIGAFDLDAANTKNSEIRFELVQPKAANGIFPFRVDPETGCIFVDAEEPLDFEQRQKYEFAVKVRRNGKN